MGSMNNVAAIIFSMIKAVLLVQWSLPIGICAGVFAVPVEVVPITERKRHVAIIAGSEKTSNEISKQLNGILHEYIEFFPFSMEQWMSADEDFDLVLISTQSIFTRRAAPRIKPGTVILILRRTLSRSGWEKIMAIPYGERCLLVNDEKDSAEETISLLYELGVSHIEMVAYYPTIGDCSQLATAITPGESHLVPVFATNVIDIGERMVDASTIVDILTQFDLLNSETKNILSAYSKRIIPRSQGAQITFQGLINTKNLMEQTLNMVQDGVVAYDSEGRVTLLNRVAESIFACLPDEVIGYPIESLLVQAGLSTDIMHQESKDKLITIRKQKIIVNKLSIENNGQAAGGLLSLHVAEKVEELELQLRIQSKGHEAKYSFHDLLTKSEQMDKTVRQAKKMANSDLSVLILGESGTGKELFAHAIHQASPRSRYPFVAVNCSALPDNLLESELFGYEDGAFTGARKGGKPGLFEQAHRGTIFLDEIGDISPSLQSRLLRVIQQKEVLKVGGTKLLPVDVRVIAATNRNLSRLVKEGTFRDDLYYRLKVLQLSIPPLRARKEDIVLLARHFLERRGISLDRFQEILPTLIEYDWPGNVRELENTLEYLAFMSDEPMTRQDVLGFLENTGHFESAAASAPQKAVAEPVSASPSAPVLLEWGERERNSADVILELIYQAKVNGGSSGRRSIVQLARERGILIRENDIRKIIDKLRADGLVEVVTGRTGCKITEAGSRRIASLKGTNGING